MNILSNHAKTIDLNSGVLRDYFPVYDINDGGGYSGVRGEGW